MSKARIVESDWCVKLIRRWTSTSGNKFEGKSSICSLLASILLRCQLPENKEEWNEFEVEHTFASFWSDHIKWISDVVYLSDETPWSRGHGELRATWRRHRVHYEATLNGKALMYEIFCSLHPIHPPKISREVPPASRYPLRQYVEPVCSILSSRKY